MPFTDPRDPVTSSRIRVFAAKARGLSTAEIKQRLSRAYHFKAPNTDLEQAVDAYIYALEQELDDREFDRSPCR